MKELLFFAGGVAVGVALMARLRPHSESTCAARVAKAARDEVGTKCGPIGFICQGIGDGLGVWPHANSILDALGM